MAHQPARKTKTSKSAKSAEPSRTSATSAEVPSEPRSAPATEAPSALPLRGRKLASVVAMLEGQLGASLGRLQALTGWKPHSVRAALSGLRKAGYVIEGSREGSTHRLCRITGRVDAAAEATADADAAAPAASSAAATTSEDADPSSAFAHQRHEEAKPAGIPSEVTSRLEHNSDTAGDVEGNEAEDGQSLGEADVEELTAPGDEPDGRTSAEDTP